MHACICVSAQKLYTVRKSSVRDSLGAGGFDMLCQGPEGAAGTPGSQRVHGEGWYWVPRAILGGCGMPPPLSLCMWLLCKKPSALRGDSLGRYGAAQSYFQRRTLPEERGVRGDHPLGVPVNLMSNPAGALPCPLPRFPAAGSLPRLFYCFDLNFSWQQARWVSGHLTV